MYWYGAYSLSIRDEYAPIYVILVGAYSVFGADLGPFSYAKCVSDNRWIWRNECFCDPKHAPLRKICPSMPRLVLLHVLNLPYTKRMKMGHIQAFFFQFSVMNDLLEVEYAPLRRICPNQLHFVLTSFLKTLNLPHSKTRQMGHIQAFYTGFFLLGPYKWLSPMILTDDLWGD